MTVFGNGDFQPRFPFVTEDIFIANSYKTAPGTALLNRQVFPLWLLYQHHLLARRHDLFADGHDSLLLPAFF